MLSCDGGVAGFYRKLLPVLLVSLWVVGRPAVAASSELSLAEALRQAQDNSPTLSAASRLVDISLGERQQAGLLPNPELSWEVEDTRSNTRTTTTQITQPIELGGKRGARIELAEKGQSAASVELERSQNELRADVIQSFYDNLQARMRVELAEQSLALAECSSLRSDLSYVELNGIRLEPILDCRLSSVATQTSGLLGVRPASLNRQQSISCGLPWRQPQKCA